MSPHSQSSLCSSLRRIPPHSAADCVRLSSFLNYKGARKCRRKPSVAFPRALQQTASDCGRLCQTAADCTAFPRTLRQTAPHSPRALQQYVEVCATYPPRSVADCVRLQLRRYFPLRFSLLLFSLFLNWKMENGMGMRVRLEGVRERGRGEE